MAILGIDVGGSGIKGGLVDVQTGALVTPRHRLPTPEEAMPEDCARVINEVRQNFNYSGPIGIGFPAVVLNEVCMTAANIHVSWIGVNISHLVNEHTGCHAFTLNDADAAGIAEMKYGAGIGHQGVVLILTIGTGIGSAIFSEGHLVPNTEFGHLQIRGKDAERRASDATRKRKNLTWIEWAERFQEYLTEMEKLFNPELIIIGGGVSKSWTEFYPYIITRAEVVPASLQNEAGIIGAAVHAEQRDKL